MSNTRRIPQRVLSLVLLTVLMLISGGLSTANAAQDFKTFPGTYCQPADMDSPNVGYFAQGLIYNKSATHGLLIHCPIIRDMISAETKWTKVVIRYYNPDPSKRIRCAMTNRRRDGTVLRYRHAFSSTTKTTDVMQINGDGTEAGTAVHTLSCSLPPSPGPGQGIPGISLIQVQEAS